MPAGHTWGGSLIAFGTASSAPRSAPHHNHHIHQVVKMRRPATRMYVHACGVCVCTCVRCTLLPPRLSAPPRYVRPAPYLAIYQWAGRPPWGNWRASSLFLHIYCRVTTPMSRSMHSRRPFLAVVMQQAGVCAAGQCQLLANPAAAAAAVDDGHIYHYSYDYYRLVSSPTSRSFFCIVIIKMCACAVCVLLLACAAVRSCTGQHKVS